MTNAELNSLKQQIDARLAMGKVGQWETQFLIDIRNRLERYGTATRLSEKQSRRLYAIVGQSTWAAVQKRRPYQLKNQVSFRSLWRSLRFLTRRSLVSLGVLAVALSVLWLQDHLTPFVSGLAKLKSSPPIRESIAGADIDVIDGDTVDVRGERFRLIGLNAPETHKPQCDRELELGTRAQGRLKDLLTTGSASLVKVPCSCPSGTEGTGNCNFGRSCAILKINGEDVAETLIGEGLAAEFHCGATTCPPLPRPWCE